MQTTVRTTIRLRKELFEKSRLLATRRKTSLQQVINDALTIGFYASDAKIQSVAMTKIDKFRRNFSNRKINVQKLVRKSRQELEAKTPIL